MSLPLIISPEAEQDLQREGPGACVSEVLMSQSMHDFPVEHLSTEERLTLLGRLWDSLLDSGELPPVPAWHIAELQRRIAEADSHPETAITLEQLRSELQRGEP